MPFLATVRNCNDIFIHTRNDKSNIFELINDYKTENKLNDNFEIIDSIKIIPIYTSKSDFTKFMLSKIKEINPNYDNILYNEIIKDYNILIFDEDDNVRELKKKYGENYEEQINIFYDDLINKSEKLESIIMKLSSRELKHNQDFLRENYEITLEVMYGKKKSEMRELLNEHLKDDLDTIIEIKKIIKRIKNNKKISQYKKYITNDDIEDNFDDFFSDSILIDRFHDVLNDKKYAHVINKGKQFMKEPEKIRPFYIKSDVTKVSKLRHKVSSTNIEEYEKTIYSNICMIHKTKKIIKIEKYGTISGSDVLVPEYKLEFNDKTDEELLSEIKNQFIKELNNLVFVKITKLVDENEKIHVTIKDDIDDLDDTDGLTDTESFDFNTLDDISLGNIIDNDNLHFTLKRDQKRYQFDIKYIESDENIDKTINFR